MTYTDWSIGSGLFLCVIMFFGVGLFLFYLDNVLGISYAVGVGIATLGLMVENRFIKKQEKKNE